MTHEVHTYRCPCGNTEMKCNGGDTIGMICQLCKRALRLVEVSR
jgi:predicted SprT family Zn-dependent metalloprotease